MKIARADTYDDCRVCTDIPSWSGLTTNSICDYPDNGSNGFVGCSERTTLFGVFCRDGAQPCLYICVGPGCNDTGGGGSTGGGTGTGGSDCSGGGYCPADCFSCGGYYY